MLAFFTALVIFGGARWLGRVTSAIVPTMGSVYLLGIFIILAMGFDQIPAALGAIVGAAFTGEAAAGGAVGAFVVGMRRRCDERQKQDCEDKRNSGCGLRHGVFLNYSELSDFRYKSQHFRRYSSNNNSRTLCPCVLVLVSMPFIKFTAFGGPIIAFMLATSSHATDTPPGPIDLDEALARQSAADLIAGGSVAYDCDISERGMRRLGTDDKPVYLIQVLMEGPECKNALLLLNRRGEINDFVFRAWEVPDNIEQIDIQNPPSAIPEE